MKAEAAKRSNEAELYRKLFDAVTEACSNKDPKPIPAKLLENVLSAGQGLANHRNDDEFLRLKSITNAARLLNSDGEVIYEFDVDGVALFKELSLPLLGDDSAAEAVMKGMLQDRNGPQIDLEKIFREQLSRHVKITCRSQNSGRLAILVEMKVIDKKAFLPNFSRLFSKEPNIEKRVENYYTFVVNGSNEKSQFVVTVIDDIFCFGTVDMLYAALKNTLRSE